MFKINLFEKLQNYLVMIYCRLQQRFLKRLEDRKKFLKNQQQGIIATDLLTSRFILKLTSKN